MSLFFSSAYFAASFNQSQIISIHGLFLLSPQFVVLSHFSQLYFQMFPLLFSLISFPLHFSFYSYPFFILFYFIPLLLASYFGYILTFSHFVFHLPSSHNLLPIPLLHPCVSSQNLSLFYLCGKALWNEVIQMAFYGAVQHNQAEHGRQS